MTISTDLEKKGSSGVEVNVVSVERRAHEEGVDSIYDMKSELGTCVESTTVSSG